MAPIIRGNSLYTSVLGPKWLEAEANAVALGGNLASIGNASENEFIRTSFNSDPLLYVPAANEYVAWFGLTFNSSSEWINTSGEKQAYFNWNPTFLDPDTTVYGQRNTTILLQSPSPYVYVQGSWDDSYENQPVPYYRNGIAEIPLTISITQSAQPKEGVGLFTTSINLSAGTQTSGNLAEGAQVWWEVTGITQDDLGAGSAGLTGTGTISSGKMDIQHSLVSDADAGEQFSVSVYSDSAMTQQIGTTISTGIQETTTSYGKTGLMGNSLYTLVQGSLWSDALSRSIAIGGTLAAIASASENQFVVNTFSDMPVNQVYGRDYRLVWIGLTDEQAEGTWKWTSNEQVTYTNWYAGSPSGDGDYADLAIANTTDAASRIAGDWNDAPNGGELYPYVSYGVAEVPLQLSITRSGTPKEGNGAFTTSINLSAGSQTSGNLAEGAQVWWKVDGITQDDLASGALTGTGSITNGKLDIQHSLVSDGDTGEQFSVSVYSDSAMTQQIGTTYSQSIQEGNSAPTDITLTSTGITENSVGGTLIGTLSATDPDAGSTFTYALAAGNGTTDADNNLVEIIGSEVRVKSGAVIDYETNPILNLNIQVTDNGNPGLTYTKAVTASVLNSNEAPTNLTLSSSGISENSTGGSLIGTLSATDSDANSTFTYALAAGNGTNDADNNLVTISGNQVLVKSGAVIDFETNPILNLNIQVTDNGNPGLTYTKAVTANVIDVVNEDITPPTITDISVQGSSVVLTLSEKIQATGINNSTFVVKVGGKARSVTANYDSTTQKASLTLSGTAPASSTSLQVTYAGTSPNIVKDIAGNSLGTFTNRSADTFLSGASVTSLYADYTNLTLTGTSAINGTGNAKNNTITGNQANNSINGAAGADILTGQGGTDTFVYTTLANSLLGTPANYTFDRITDFAIGQDKLDGPKTVSTTQLLELGAVATLDQSGLQGVLTATKFVANGAASFTFGSGSNTRTFVAMNDGVAGFDVTKDSVVEITGYSGLLTNLAIV